MATTLDPKRWQACLDLVSRWIDEGKIPAVSLCVGVNNRIERTFAEGRFDPTGNPGPAMITTDSPFLAASLTKPVTVTAAMMLVEKGLLRLNDRVADFIPAMNTPDKGAIRIRHLMTHTSGLPDMLPENDSLRAAHASFPQFVDAICQCEMQFEPGSRVAYQSMGTALLAEVVHQISGRRLGEFLRSELFEPLGMSNARLGVTGEEARKIVKMQISSQQAKTDWNWNSDYWLGFGAPWGGMTSTARDLSRFVRMFLSGGQLGRVRILAPQTVSLMRSSQMHSFSKLSESDQRYETWGLGWRIFGLGVGANMGELLCPECFGHHGATGALMWGDPVRNAYAVILTSQPYDRSATMLMRLSNAISAAFVEE